MMMRKKKKLKTGPMKNERYVKINTDFPEQFPWQKAAASDKLPFHMSAIFLRWFFTYTNELGAFARTTFFIGNVTHPGIMKFEWNETRIDNYYFSSLAKKQQHRQCKKFTSVRFFLFLIFSHEKESSKQFNSKWLYMPLASVIHHLSG